MNKKKFPQMLRNVLDKFGQSDGWNRVIKKIKKRTPIARIRCPVCNKYELEFRYNVSYRNPSKPKHNRVGGGWVGCQNCRTSVTWYGRIPDWYIEPDEGG